MPFDPTNLLLEIATKELVSKVVGRWLKPSLDKASDRKALMKISREGLEQSFWRYLQRSAVRYSKFQSIVFPTGDRGILDYFLSPTLVSTEDKQVSHSISEEIDLTANLGRRCLIVDDAGMGKTTLLQYLFLKNVERPRTIPIFLPLRRLSTTTTPLDLIQSELDELDLQVPRSVLSALLRKGDFTFYLDGLDEVSQPHLSQVVFELDAFISKASNNEFVITSRDCPAIRSLSGFKVYSIRPLSFDEACALIKRYDQNGEVGNALVAELRSKPDRRVIEYLSSPLLTGLLYRTYLNYPSIPTTSSTFYGNVVSTLLHDHDRHKTGGLTRDFESGLDIDDLHRVLRAFAFSSMIKSRGPEYTKHEVVSLLDGVNQMVVGPQFSPTGFIEDFTRTSLIVKEGQRYRWLHKSMMEFLAAQYLDRDTKDLHSSVLRKLASDHALEFNHVLLLYADLNYSDFLHQVILPVLDELRGHLRSGYSSEHFASFDELELALRRYRTFREAFLFMKIEKGKVNEYIKKLDNQIQSDPKLRHDFERRRLWADKEWELVAATAGTYSILPLVEDVLTRKESSIAEGKEYYIQQIEFDVAADTIAKALPLGRVTVVDDDEANPLNSNPDVFGAATHVAGGHFQEYQPRFAVASFVDELYSELRQRYAAPDLSEWWGKLSGLQD